MAKTTMPDMPWEGTGYRPRSAPCMCTQTQNTDPSHIETPAHTHTLGAAATSLLQELSHSETKRHLSPYHPIS